MQDDRLKYGYDAGNIVDGVVTIDAESDSYLIVDCDGDVFDVKKALQSLVGRRIRLTMISFDALDNMKEMYENAARIANSDHDG